MFAVKTIGAVALAAGLLAPAAPAIAANGPHMAGPGSTANALKSLNWAGYVTTSGGTSASANWVVPSVRGANGWSASWVGVDGFGSDTVEQTGTDSAVWNGAHVYYAWVELYPAMPVVLHYASGAEAPVHPGDRMSGSVRAKGDHYTTRLIDHTEGWNYAQTFVVPSGSNASAEVITEAPSESSTGRVLPLANFGNEHFTDVRISGHATRTIMVNHGGRAKATVTGSQRNFTVHFKHSK